MDNQNQPTISISLNLSTTIEDLEKLVVWLKNSPFPLNPLSLQAETGIQGAKVNIKAAKVVSKPLVTPQPAPHLMIAETGPAE